MMKKWIRIKNTVPKILGDGVWSFFRQSGGRGHCHEPEAPVQVDNVGHGGNGTAEHLFLHRGGNAHILRNILQAEAEIENILQLLTEVVISYRNGISSALVQEQKQIIDMLQGRDLLQKGQGDQMGDLMGGVPLLNGVGDQALLDVVADHGPGDILEAQGTDALIHILSCLLQIQTHIGDLMIPWETKSTHGAGERVCNFLIHRAIIMRKTRIVNVKRWVFQGKTLTVIKKCSKIGTGF